MISRNYRSVLLIAVLALLPCRLASAVTWYVDDSHTQGTLDGTSWATAFQYLQEALDRASGGDTIKVAQGTYHPDDGSGHTADDPAETFLLESGVVIEGGYIGYDDQNPDTRDWELYVTILSGDLGGQTSNVVVTGNGVTQLAKLDGFTITGAAQHAILNNNSVAKYENLLITANQSSLDGAGMFNNNNSSPRVFNCTFSLNEAQARHLDPPHACTLISGPETGLLLGEYPIAAWSAGSYVRTCGFRDPLD